MTNNKLTVRGVRVHNLKNIDLEIPRDSFVVFTGLSGSGKSSLAFDTIYAEGHRRFVESLSSYARMFLGQLDKPDIDSIEGLSPAVSIDQKTTSKNPRSTVGTVTEIYDYLRLLYARVGIPHCPICGKEIVGRTTDSIIDEIMTFAAGTRFLVLAPVVRGKKGMHEKVIEEAKKSGYNRLRIDGSMYESGEEITLDKNLKHTVEIVVDRLIMKDDLRPRLAESVEAALRLAEGSLIVSIVPDSSERGAKEGVEPVEYTFSQAFACEEHGVSMPELTPRLFSFNSPQGACDACSGLGESTVFSPEKLIPDRTLSLREGAVAVNGFKSLDTDSWNGPMFLAVGEKYGFDLDTPIENYSPRQFEVLMYGAPDTFNVKRRFEQRTVQQTIRFEGVANIVKARYEQSHMDYYEAFMDNIPCPKCGGKRLKPEVLAVTVGGKSIDEFCRLSASGASDFAASLKLKPTEAVIAKEILAEIKSRTGFLVSVGLDYLTLSRRAGTLSGGEAQRIRLATQIGSALMGVLYILDEPSIGLHQRDNDKLIATLKRLRDAGNSLIVVEHDEETMLASDYIVDIGPGAGVHGGEVVAAGTPQELMNNPKSITGDYLSGRRTIAVPEKRREGSGKYLRVLGARQNNLKNINAEIPLGKFVCVTGVSGSGKSSLVNGVLYPALANELNGAHMTRGVCDKIEGIENLDKIVAVDQSPIGRTPRSNPATYTGLFGDIRDLFASTPDAKRRGYGPGRFSFNTRGGRCEACEGDGVKKVEMHFLPDIYVTCEACKGRRYNRDTLEVKYKGKSVSDVLEMTVEEGLRFFSSLPKLARKLQTLYDVGLGYVKIGQSSTTLSGGEAQRVKLATELSRRDTGRTVYILDEPTTGLHSADVDKLITVLQRFVDGGNTVLVIEHNLDMIKVADHIIDLGPEGGERGGQIIAVGTPEQIAECENSWTGRYLGKRLEASR